MNLPVIENCDDCGACCMTAGVPPFTDAEFAQLDDEVQTELSLYRILGRSKGMVCAWLDSSRKCDGHDIRPDECRNLQRGSDDCLMDRAKYNID